MAKPTILDAWGRPIQRARLTEEIAGARVGTPRSPSHSTLFDGMTPVRLTNMLRAMDMGEPRQFLELAEVIEERDPHYQGVLGTRRRSVAMLEITVEAGSEDPEDEVIAQMVRNWIDRDELATELFNILDCLGKGYSATEVTYQESEGQYMPRLHRRDPRSFRFDRNDLETPMLIRDDGQSEPLEPGHFIWATIQSKSGLALRGGLARTAAWGWLFKAYAQRDWAIFTQTYGQPLRLGKYGAGASEEDKETLFQAVSDIAGDCGAIVPESMSIEFVQTGNIGAAHQLYKERCDWIDQQISKAVLGQTSTTDAVVGGLGSGKEHREVQKDIQAADARALAAILNRDLVRVWVQLEYGPRKVYPRICIKQTDEEDLKALTDAVGPMIDRGMEIDMADLRTRFGLPEPKAGAKLLLPLSAGAGRAAPLDQSAPTASIKYPFNTHEPLAGGKVARQAEGPVAGKKPGSGEIDPATLLADRMAVETGPAMASMLGQIEVMLGQAGSLDEFHAMLMAGFPTLDATSLAGTLARGMLVADAAGRVAVLDEDGAAEPGA